MSESEKELLEETVTVGGVTLSIDEIITDMDFDGSDDIIGDIAAEIEEKVTPIVAEGLGTDQAVGNPLIGVFVSLLLKILMQRMSGCLGGDIDIDIPLPFNEEKARKTASRIRNPRWLDRWYISTTADDVAKKVFGSNQVTAGGRGERIKCATCDSLASRSEDQIIEAIKEIQRADQVRKWAFS